MILRTPLLALGLVLAPVAAHAQDSLGKSMAGEECRSVLRQGMRAYPNAPRPLDVYCGESKEAVGAVWTDGLPSGLSADGTLRRAALEAAARGTLEGQSVARRMSCGGAEALADDQSALFYSCTLREGSWPQIVLVVASGGRLYQAEGLPSMLPVLAAAIDRAAGTPAFTGAREAGLKRIEATLAASGGSVGSADLIRFREFMRLGRLYNSTRNFPASEDAFRRALEEQTRIFGADTPATGEVLMELALAVSNEGRYEEAGALFRRAEPILTRLDDATRARFYLYLALDDANQGKYQPALGYARQSTALSRQQIGSSADAISDITASDPHIGAKGAVIRGLITESALSLRLNNVGAAQASIAEALEMMTQVKGLPVWWRPEALMQLGDVESAQDRVYFAERNLRMGAQMEQRIFGNTAPTARAYLRLARFYASQDYPEQAAASFELAAGILRDDEAGRAQVTPDDILPFLSAASALAKADPSRHRQLDSEMFAASQLTRSGVAEQAVAHASARLAAGDPAIATLIRDEQEAERDRDAARLALSNEQSKPDDQRGRLLETALAKRADDAAAKAGDLQQKLLQAYPDFSRFAAPQAAGLDDLQHHLGPGEAFLTFIIGRDGGYALLVRSDRLIARPIQVTQASLTQDVSDLRKSLVIRGGVVPPFDLRAANALYKSLLGPLDADLADVHHLIAAPAGALASLPLGLLVSAPVSPGAYGSAQWLVRRMAVSEVPSPKAFLELRAAQASAKPAPRPFLGIGNPSFGGGAGDGFARFAMTCRQGGAVPPELIRALAPLPETAEEVRRVGQRLHADPGSILVGADASEANFRRRPLGDYNVIYFATHGLLPGELRCASEPGLALTPSGDGTAQNDGLLEASEVASLRLNAGLVVLSACNTASSGLGGDSLSGLADAFFHAGARTLIASHWPVASSAAAQLMIGVFDRLGPNLDAGVAESLRQAQLAMIASPPTAHPFYWAAFAVMGDGGAPGAAHSASAGGSIGSIATGAIR